jgi:hypothetical protein
MDTSILQAVSDHIDQLDLALDQLAMRDRNFDRFALMLVDNVVELTLHQYAQDKNTQNEMWRRFKQPETDPKAVAAALGPHFDAKVKLAKATGMISADTGETIQYLHSFRNAAYHRGLRHERILHALSLTYFREACSILADHVPGGTWMSSSTDRISHRAMKYLGGMKTPFARRESFPPAFERLRDVADAMGDTLVADLHADMERTVKRVDEALAFLEENVSSKPKKTRKQIVVDAQVWPIAFTDEGRSFAAKNGGPDTPVPKYVEWLLANYPVPTRTDPVHSWRKRVASLKSEKKPHAALKKYCDFMNQTQEIRDRIHEHADGLESWIQDRIDEARGK